MSIHVLTKEVRVDSRGRVTLGQQAVGKKYRVESGEDGEIILTPIVTIPAKKQWLWNNPTALASVQRGIQDAASGHVSTRRSYAEVETDVTLLGGG